MGEGVERRPDSDPDQRDNQPIGAGGKAGQQEDRPEAYLEGTHVLQEVLVERLELRGSLEEGARIEHRPDPDRDEEDAADDRNRAGKPGTHGRQHLPTSSAEGGSRIGAS
jgi:hypothetical protein